jgi:hypothetical protein
MIKTIFKVMVFAISFAFVEAAVVVYLRHLLGSTQLTVSREETLFLVPGITFLEPQTAVKIITNTAILNVERVREAATLVMLAAVAVLAGKSLKEKTAYFFLSFGIWDICYYLFLRLAIDWPKDLSDLDVFFLLPTPWIGPVFVPIAISSVLIISSLFYLLKFKK